MTRRIGRRRKRWPKEVKKNLREAGVTDWQEGIKEEENHKGRKRP